MSVDEQEKNIDVKRGGDDSYLEFDVDQMDELIDSVVESKNKSIKHLVLKSGRVSLSELEQIQSFKNAIWDLAGTNECKLMTKKQFGFFVFKKIFEKGLEFWSNE